VFREWRAPEFPKRIRHDTPWFREFHSVLFPKQHQLNIVEVNLVLYSFSEGYLHASTLLSVRRMSGEGKASAMLALKNCILFYKMFRWLWQLMDRVWFRKQRRTIAASRIGEFVCTKLCIVVNQNKDYKSVPSAGYTFFLIFFWSLQSSHAGHHCLINT